VCGSIKCFFWTTIGITDLSLTSKRSSMKGGGALLPELCAGFIKFPLTGTTAKTPVSEFGAFWSFNRVS